MLIPDVNTRHQIIKLAHAAGVRVFPDSDIGGCWGNDAGPNRCLVYLNGQLEGDLPRKHQVLTAEDFIAKMFGCQIKPKQVKPKQIKLSADYTEYTTVKSAKLYKSGVKIAVSLGWGSLDWSGQIWLSKQDLRKIAKDYCQND